MSPRLVAAALLLLAALGVWLGIARPARQARDAERAEFARAREERERLRASVASAERTAARATTPQAGAAAARSLRASLLRAADGLDVEGVRIAAGSERGRSGAQGRLSAAGRMREVLLLADRLTRGEPGVTVERVSITSSRGDEGDVTAEIECATAGAAR